jgi:hypothetical protein
MRNKWWSDHYKNSNGYFGCETTRHAGKVTGISEHMYAALTSDKALTKTDTWAYFEVKQLFKKKDILVEKIQRFYTIDSVD